MINLKRAYEKLPAMTANASSSSGFGRAA